MLRRTQQALYSIKFNLWVNTAKREGYLQDSFPLSLLHFNITMRKLNMAKKKKPTTIKPKTQIKVYTKTPSYLMKGNPISRAITVLVDQIPTVGIIKEHIFKTSLGAGIIFTRRTGLDHAPGFDLKFYHSEQYWTAVELREAAEEFVKVAEYLEKLEEKDVVQS